MAAFTPVTDKTTQVPSVVNSISSTSQPLPNKSAAAAVEGVSNLFDTAVKAESAREDRSMTKRAYELVDEKRNAVGIDDAAMNSRIGVPVKGAILDNENDYTTNPAAAPGDDVPTTGTSDATDFSGRKRTPGDDSTPLPSAGETMIARAARMQRAVEAGKLGNSEYSAGLEAIVRQLRAEYPGSREEIDQKISQITGQTPANSLRASLLRDQITAERAARSAETYERNYRDKNAKYAPDLADAPFSTFRRAVIEAQGMEHAVTSSTAALNYKAKQGEDQSAQAQKVVTQAATFESDSVIRTFGTGIQKLVDRGTPLSNQEIEQMRPQMNVLRANMEKRFESIMDRPVDYDPAHPDMKGSGPTLRTLIRDPNKVAAMKKDTLGKIDDLEQQLINGSFGWFNANANSAKANYEAADAGMMRNEYLARAAVVKQRHGEAVLNIMMGDNSNGTALLPTLQKAVLDSAKTSMGTDKPESPSATAQKLEDAAQKPNQPPITASSYRALMADRVRLMTDKEVPDSIKQTAVESVVNDAKFLYKFKPGFGQVTAYSTLYSPEVTNSVKELAVPTPKLWQEYKAAAVRNFAGVYKVEADDAQSVNKVEGYKTVFDPKAGQFSVVAEKGRGPIEDDARKANLEVYQARVDNLNKGLRTLGAVLGKDKEEVGPQLLLVAKSMGVNPDAPKEGFWDGIAQAVGKTIKKADKDISTVFEPTIKD